MNDPQQRALHFRFFSRAFAYPNEAFMPELRKCATELTDTPEIFMALIGAFEQEETEQLQGEYTQLFLNGYPTTPCVPYESVYLEKRMLGESSIGVQAAYSEWEMTVAPGLIDHIATEFEFLAFLASAESMEGSLAKDARTARETFMKEHLCRWMPRLAADMAKSARMEPYRILAAALKTISCTD
ncbi:cytoplasmic chaperone TorD family protein [Chlorobium phaeovibrioides]|uniref:Cytoplasmic chaperone TorD family protein n=2 Tax=Chlorobium phaeovibrioides TaxID=1094 RepID=A0A432AX85_CHLPH|nr:molecular chaperone TorD family protein [Chlorobium phaeovibrioides]MWV54215.1 cytoplasmic chaperone TorD family protein [Chlorobium phaeovibrioides]RTY39447.1 cytoplasmic chaperone TorD family protein [Chlorobium phaeovibrioides]